MPAAKELKPLFRLMNTCKKNNKSFTLIELLVVISIIAILSTIVLININKARAKARDARRLSDIKAILLALELYYDKYERYPSNYGEYEAACGNWDTSTVDNDGDGKPFLEPLQDEGFLSVVPTDPVGTGTCAGLTYRYFRYSAGSNGCDPARGAYFVLGVNLMEGCCGYYSTSPGFSCPGRDWTPQFAWVTGEFEK